MPRGEGSKPVPETPKLCWYRRPGSENCLTIKASLAQEFEFLRINPGKGRIAHVGPVQHGGTACSQPTQVLRRLG